MPEKIVRGYMSGACTTCGDVVIDAYGPMTRKFLYCNRDCQYDVYNYGERKKKPLPLDWQYGNPWFDDNHFKQSFLDEFLKCKA